MGAAKGGGGGGDVSPSSSAKDNRCNAFVSSPKAQKAGMMECDSPVAPPAPEKEHSGREKLKRHWTEVAGRVLVPEKWGQEGLLREWMDYSSFDALLAPKGLLSARQDLISQAKRTCSSFFKSQ